MTVVRPDVFRERDLNLQVRLDTCADGEHIDYTGKKSYTFGLMKKGIGFGITDIDIEINASLQPIIEITFKDLYGNTLFGTQRVGGSLRNEDGGFNKSTATDYSVIFNWPPPKFYFTFKGYLGEPVTWILNLKKTSTSFDASDQSFELKATFVPNQWGFFADIPFLYLLAVKSLKVKYGDTAVNPFDVTTLYDIIKVGKQVDVQKNETSKTFDLLLNQVSAYQSNITGAINTSRLIKSQTPVTGIVNGEKVTDFIAFQVVEPDIPSTEKASLLNDAGNFEKYTSFLVTQCTFFESGGGYNQGKMDVARNSSFSQIANHSIEKNRNEFERVMKIMADNREAIEREIQRTIITTNQKELSSLTISNVLSKMAGDAGYILGRILQAGSDAFIAGNDSKIQGGGSIAGFSTERNSSGSLIGKNFPMMIKDGKEVPATKDNYGSDIGVEEFEMRFVDNFIRSIADGIVANRVQDGELSAGQDNKLKKRVNNGELAQENPYSSSYNNIASNILERSGVIAFVTRSNDPNKPGTYTNTTNWFPNDVKNNIIQLATADMDNITEGIISGLFDDDIRKLKRFCQFFKNVFNADGEMKISNADGSFTTLSIGTLFGRLQQNKGETIKESLDVRVRTTDLEGEEEVISMFDFFDNDVKDLLLYSQSNDVINEVGSFTTHYQLDRMLNNNVPYKIRSPEDAQDDNENGNNDDLVYMIQFEGDDISKATSANSGPTDFDSDTDNHDDPSGVLDAEEPEGIVVIPELTDENGDTLGRVKYYNFDYKANYKVYDFEKMKTYGLNFITKGPKSLANPFGPPTIIRGDFLEPDTFISMLATGQLEDDDDLPPGGVAFTVFTQINEDRKSDDDLVWAPFMNSREGANHRRALWAMCNTLFEKLKEEEQKRRELVGTILGNAKEQRDILYKQFHLIYNQWNILAYDEIDSFIFKDGEKKRTNICLPTQLETGLAEKLEKRYGASHLDVVGTSDEGSLPRDTTFRYDFPMNAVRGSGIKVRDALVNIEPLYKPKANTSVLNAIQQICQKNNFIFIPIPGNADYRSVKEIYSPQPSRAKINVRNYFHVLFAPTPERRAYGNGGSVDHNNSGSDEAAKQVQAQAIEFIYGSVDNKIVRNINVSTDENKITAESIVNLQRLVDNENRNKKVTTDCSMLPVLEGRSYKCTVEMLGNAQVYPMQYFFIPRMPMFGGLYQIMKVKHKIQPNDMVTTAEGLKMLLAGKEYGAQEPVTLASLANELNVEIDSPNEEANTARDDR